MSTSPDAASILLEAGTNEVEILAFHLGERRYGINVAKVREVIRPTRIIDVPRKHPSVLGLFEIRDRVLTLIDLGIHLGLRSGPLVPEEGVADARSIIVTQFNDHRLGFMIDRMDRIHRVGWDQIKPVPCAPGSSVGRDSLASGILPLDDGLVILVDVESVATGVLDDRRMEIGAVENETGVDRGAKTVVIAEDSALIRAQMKRALLASGYGRVEDCPDGAKAWATIARLGPVVDAVVSDIEMPALDGRALTRRIREDPRTAAKPVVLFSSLVSEENALKGRAVGATLQIRKPELAELVRIVDHLTAGVPYTPPTGVRGHAREKCPSGPQPAE